MVKILSLTLLVIVVTSSAVAAQQPRVLEPVVVTATKVEIPQERVGASVTVVTEEELRSLNYSRIEDALRSVPGVEVQRSGSLGKTTSVTIRGSNANQVQILIDGMRVKSPTLGQFDFADLSLDAIERIEVVRGPQSSLHGADAIGGVIQIITKKGTGGPQGAVSAEAGSQRTFREQAAASGSLGWFNYSLSGSKLDSRGQERTFDNDDSDQRAIAARLGFDFPWKGSFTATGRYAKSFTDVPNNLFLATRDPDSQQQTEFSLVTAKYEQRVLPWWRVQGRFGQMWNNQGFENGPEPAGDFAFVSQVNTRRREFEVLNVFDAGKVNTTTVGFEHRREWGESRGNFHDGFDTDSVFLQSDLALFERVFLGGGFRMEDNEVFGTEWTPRASLAYLLKETGTKLRGGYGHGFRAPTINDLFFPDQTGGLCPPFGNVALKPERSRSWEAGIDQKVWDNRVRLGATYFRNDFHDLITIVNVTPTPLGLPFVPFGLTCQQSGNVGKARTQGLEWSSEVEPLDWLVFNVNYTFTDTENLTTHTELFRFARHRWNLGVTVTPIKRVSFFVQSHVVSRQLDNVTNAHNPGYYRVDVGGTFRLVQKRGVLEGLDLTWRIQNLTDTNYSEAAGFRALGFAGLAGLKAYFR